MTAPEEHPKIRLPELPIFQKYSIALRQEFADAAEFESILEKTLKRVRSATGPSPASLQGARHPDTPTPDSGGPAVDGATEAPSPPAVDGATEAPSPPAVDGATEAPRTDMGVPAAEAAVQAPRTDTGRTHVPPDSFGPGESPGQSASKAPLAENEPKPDPEEAAFWEMALPDAPQPPRKKPRRKARPVPSIVRVSSSGKPIVEKSGKARRQK